MTELLTERLALRQFTAADVADYARMCADPEVMRFAPRACSADHTQAWQTIACLLGHWQLRGYGTWAVVERETGRLLGQVGYRYPEGWPGVELGWMLDRHAWGRGVAAEAATAALAQGHAQFGLDRVVALVHRDNLPSVRLARRLGGVAEGDVRLAGQHLDVYRLPLPPGGGGVAGTVMRGSVRSEAL